MSRVLFWSLVAVGLTGKTVGLVVAVLAAFALSSEPTAVRWLAVLATVSMLLALGAWALVSQAMRKERRSEAAVDAYPE